MWWFFQANVHLQCALCTEYYTCHVRISAGLSCCQPRLRSFPFHVRQMLCSSHERWAVTFLCVLNFFFLKCSTVVTYYSGYLIIWAAEKPYKLIDILGKGLMAALSMESWTDRLLQSCSRKRAPVSVGEEFQKCVLSCHPHRTQGPMGLTHASDGCDIYGPACISFMERQLLG